jgi:hypothetical protein
MRKQQTCIMCKSPQEYLWDETKLFGERPTTNLDKAIPITIFASYGSELDGDIYVGTICDGCVRILAIEGDLEAVGLSSQDKCDTIVP